MLHGEFAHRLPEADVYAWVGGFREDAHVGRALELGSWIWLGYAPSLEFKNVELVKDSSPLQPETHHSLIQIPFFGGCIPSSVH